MFIEKQMELMSAMKQSNYELFDNDAEDAYDTLERIFSAFVEYANCVIRMQVMIPIWRNRYDGEELRDKVQDIDQARHVYHESAISSLKQLNRLCSIYGLSPYADIDTSDRYAVADFVGTWVSEIYEDGKSRKMDTSVAGKISEYPLYCIRQKSE